jgi:integrase
LTFPQARRLLETIDRTTPHGARDYAMIKMGFYTGRRPTEIREIRWGDIQHTADGRVRYHWTGKGSKSRWDDLPHPVYEAICVYLEQTGRREGIHADDYVFVPHDAAGDPRNETISQQWFNDLVKGYAQEAGLGDWVHAHTLRHTAAAFRDEVGEDLWAIGRLLNHSDPKTTQVYVPRLRGYQDTGWRRVQQLLEGESAPCWLDTLDEALCALASAADDKYTEDVAQAHGILQAVLGGVESIGRLLEPVG